MITSVLIRPGLYLNSQVVKPAREKSEKVAVIPDNLNHLFIIDRSGSMYGLLRDLCNDIIRRVQELPENDSVTLAWFSGEGQYRFVLKGVVLNSDKARKSVIDTISGLMSTVGMTCFSEVLSETHEVLLDLKHLTGDFTLFFLTDGNPCVSNYSKEIASIETALRKLHGRLNYSAFVGYGDYYNKELMDKMAQYVGGSSFHSDSFKAIQEHIVTYIDVARSSAPAVEYQVPGSIGAFHIKGKSIVMLDSEREKVCLTPNRWDKSTLYWFSYTNAAPTSVPTEDMIKGLYAGAVASSKADRLDVALDCLGVLCDYDAYCKLSNSFTASEIGEAEALINKRVYFAKSRPADLLKPMPVKANNYSMLDLLQDLASDGVEVVLSHPDFQYKAIGVGAVQKPGYPTFKKKDDVRVPINSLVWNESRLNLSMSTRIPGTVDLGPNTMGFAEKDYPTFIYRTYTLIKDGNKNVLKLPVVMDKATADKYRAKGVQVDDAPGPEVYVLDLTHLPVINRSSLPVEFKAKDLAQLSTEELQLEARLKALKAKLDPEAGEKGQSITKDQIDWLKTKGINANGFNPPREEVEAKDVYTAPVFEIGIKSFSSLPSINAVNAKLVSKKNLTPSEALLKKHMDEVASVRDHKSEFELTKKALWKLRHELHSTKFKFVMSKKSFADISGREGTIDHNGYTVSFKVENKEFEY